MSIIITHHEYHHHHHHYNFFPVAYGSIHAMSIYLRRGVEYRDNDLMITGEALLKYTVQKHHLIVHDSDIRVVRVRQDGTCYHQ